MDHDKPLVSPQKWNSLPPIHINMVKLQDFQAVKVNVERRLFLGGAKGEQRPRQETSDPSGSKDLTRPNLGPKSMLKKFGKDWGSWVVPHSYMGLLSKIAWFSAHVFTLRVWSHLDSTIHNSLWFSSDMELLMRNWCSLVFQTPFIEGMTRPPKNYTIQTPCPSGGMTGRLPG